MANNVDIANLALTSLGADVILALDQDSENARRVNAVYNLLLDGVLRAHPWSFAIKRFKLPQVSAAPIYEYDYAYQLPTDCLRLIDLYDKDGRSIDGDTWEKEGSTVLSNDTEIYAKYVSRVTDASQYDANFVEAFAARIAAEICYPITNGATLSKSLMDVYKEKLKLAKAFNAQEAGTPNIVGGDTYVQARL